MIAVFFCWKFFLFELLFLGKNISLEMPIV